MLNKYDFERIEDQKFYSETVKGFVEIKETAFTFNGQTIDLKNVSVLDTETQELISAILYETKTKYRLEKATINSGKHKKYLMGKNQDGEKVWLKTPSWDCYWYWGFGYLETKDSFFHVSGLAGKVEYWDAENQYHRLTSEYIHNIYDSPILIETTFTSNEGWKLSELFKEFYLLKDMAEYTHRNPASCNYTTSPVTQDPEKMSEWHRYINEVMIPMITTEICRMLDSDKEKTDEQTS